jgi:hypothetical protein
VEFLVEVQIGGRCEIFEAFYDNRGLLFHCKKEDKRINTPMISRIIKA